MNRLELIDLLKNKNIEWHDEEFDNTYRVKILFKNDESKNLLIITFLNKWENDNECVFSYFVNEDLIISDIGDTDLVIHTFLNHEEDI